MSGGLDGAPTVDPDDARRTADEILRDGAYAEPTQSLLDRALEWLFDQLGSAFGTLAGGGPGSAVAWIVVVVLVAAAVWLVVRALRSPGVRRRARDAGVEYGTETTRDAQVWLDEAARLAAAGDHRGALRCRHQAWVARLVTAGVVRDVAGQTAGEYARAAQSVLGDESATIARLTERFDAVWYGGEAADDRSYSAFESDCASVEATALARSDEAVPA